MGLTCVLIANRGEIAIRVARACADLGVRSVAVSSEDDAGALHVRRADVAVPLAGRGPRAYLDAAALVAVAERTGCDAVHPGYGFLSEQAGFARACLDAGLVWIGPRPDVLERFGDKAAGRALATACGVPVLAGTAGATSLEDAHAFLAALPDGAAVMVKAVAGGGGRGMRVVRAPSELDEAWARCRSEAEQAFGVPDVFVEQLLAPARHVEVQVVGDGSGAVVHLGERDCSLQRRHQKVVEVAPAPGLDEGVRRALWDSAVRMAQEVRYDGVGTFEFLVGPGGQVAFLEANARLQVEHTVTEEVAGVDLVQAQLRLAGGEPLSALGLAYEPRGSAIQVRVNAESIGPDGTVRPVAGTVTTFEPPTGPGVRVDTSAAAGVALNPAFDPLLAKLIVHAPSGGWDAALARARRALGELRIEGVATNAALLRRLLARPEVAAGELSTGFVEAHLAELAAPDPLAVLDQGRAAAPAPAPVAPPAVDGPGSPVVAPMLGTLRSLEVAEGDAVRAGQAVAVLEAMKMEHLVPSPVDGIVRVLTVSPGDTVAEGQPLAFVEPAEVGAALEAAAAEVDLDRIRPDLAEVLDRHALGLDAARPDAVAKRRRTGQRTTRENVDDLLDPGSFVEYAPLVIAAQRRRRALQDLIERTPADGLVGGIGRVEGAPVIAMSYDYTVLAGTQGTQNHRKKDRLFELAEHQRLPLVLFAEGGGGRPGDTDGVGVAGLDCLAFMLFARLSGLVPLVGITSGRCFAGNAALLGCCDVVIATEGSSIGMGGPAMIEGGGLGVVHPDEVGPMSVQVPNGVVDVAVRDEAEAVAVAKQYLGYFTQPAVDGWECADQRLLRSAIPENRLRIYDVRSVIAGLCDTGSVLELRRAFGKGMVTALARIEGRAVGVVANDPTHLAGAIDADAADKGARFLQLCDAHDVPVLFLCDTPGIMVGPDAERTGLVRHASRMFVVGANLSVPTMTIVLRKGYGLGAQAMAGGSFKAPAFLVSWPTGEFGGMGLEGAVKLGYRNELAAVEDPVERQALFEEMVARMYEHGKAVSMATSFEIDDVIDPADSRRWITTALTSAPPPPRREGKKRPNIDTW